MREPVAPGSGAVASGTATAEAAMPGHAIAIIGLAGRFPGAQDLDAFWRQVSEGVDQLIDLDAADLDAAGVSAVERSSSRYVPRGTFLERCDEFDAGFFGYAPREAQVIDPQHRVFLECAWEALEHAGYAAACGGAPGSLPDSVGVYAGASMNTYLFTQVARNPALAQAVGGYQLMLGNDKDFLCTRVSYKLGLRGPSLTIQTACSTSLVAVQVACRALQRGECDMALAGGASIPFPQRAGYVYQEGMIFSPDGRCRPFDEAAQGTRAGAGAGIVVLKRLDQALADGDTVHAVIRGIAINNDGAAKAGYTAPSVEGQAEVVATAQALAGVAPSSIGYIEAHGTATPLGDPIEIAALTQVFRADTAERGFCRLGSLKANLGHLDAAAGVAGLIKTVLALEHRELPPLVHFRAPNPALKLDESPFYASAAKATWLPRAGVPRRAGVSSFGIGGTNAHAVLEEAPALVDRPETPGRQLLVWSARSAAALDAATRRLALHLESHPEQTLADVAHTLQVGRQAFAHRRALVAGSSAQALAALAPPHATAGAWLSAQHEGGARPVVMLFSGQGSQHIGMGRGLYDTEPVYRDVIDRCAVLLEPHLGTDLRAVMFGAADGRAGRAGAERALGALANAADSTEIDETRFTQPALFVCELALAAVWRARGVTPAAMLGHSIGELVAAHLAGVMSLPDALAAVAARGRLMQAQSPGAMAAVHLPAADLPAWLEGCEGLEIAAINAPRLCTVSGPVAAVQALVARLAGAGIDARALRTSHAFHSAMMAPAAAAFAAVMQDIDLSPPTQRWVSNVTGKWVTAEQATSPAYWAEHLRRPVLFEAGLRTLSSEAALAGAAFVEVGPGQSLTALARTHLGAGSAGRAVASMRRPADPRADDDMLLETTARLWLAGVGLDWAGLHGGQRRLRVPLPTYPFERRRYAVDAAPSPAPSQASTQSAAAMGAGSVSASPRSLDTAVPRSAHIDDWFYAPTWTRDDALPGRPDTAAAPRWVLLGGDDPLTRALAVELQQRGASVLLVRPGEHLETAGAGVWQANPSSSEDLRGLLMQAAAASGSPATTPRLAGLIHLWGLPGALAAPIAASEHTYDRLITLGSALADAANGQAVRLLHVTAGAESVLGEAVTDARAALARGPTLVLPQERAGLHLRNIDLDAADWQSSAAVQRCATALADEAAHALGEAQVAHRAGRRWLRRYERLSLPPANMQQLPLRRHGVYLITGGTGGMGLAMARWLAEGWQARLVLTARRGLPARETWDTWIAAHGPSDAQSQAMAAVRDIEACGGEVLLASADVADEAAMALVIDQARRRFGGSLHGLVHAAGGAGQGRIAALAEPEAARATFAPKVEGLAVLTRLLGGEALDLVVLTSSISGVIGAPGTCDYAAANAVLDAFVDSRECPTPWRQVVAVDWGAWREVGMAARLAVPEAMRERWSAHLAQAIAPAAGIEALSRVLASGRKRVVVETYDVVRSHELMRRAAAAVPAHAAASEAHDAAPNSEGLVSTGVTRPALSTPFAPPTSEFEVRLAAIWEELLGVRGIGIDDDFFELGGHSLMFTRVLALVDEGFGKRLPLHEVFDASTIRLLAERLSGSAADDATPQPGPGPHGEAAREVLEL